MLKIIAAALFLVWGVAILLGKGGLNHIVLLNAVGVSFVEAVTILRGRESR